VTDRQQTSRPGLGSNGGSHGSPVVMFLFAMTGFVLIAVLDVLARP
jgi:hypothetical protein